MKRQNLRDSIDALLELDARGALVPHGVGGLARQLLTEARRELTPWWERWEPNWPLLIGPLVALVFMGLGAWVYYVNFV